MRMRKLRGPHMKKSMPFEPFRTHTQPVNLLDLEARFDAGAAVDARGDEAKGLATRKGVPVKVLGQGRALQAADRPRARVPQTAREQIEAAGGTCQRRSRSVPRTQRDRHDPRRVQGRARSARRSCSRRRSSRSTGSGPTSRRRASTPARSTPIQKNFGGNGILGLLNLFSGGGLGRIAIFALGIMPYITASIILQLLTVVVPSLEKLQKEGEVGQARITQYTRYLTVGLAFAQSIGYVFLFRSFEKQAGATLIAELHPRSRCS